MKDDDLLVIALCTSHAEAFKNQQNLKKGCITVAVSVGKTHADCQFIREIIKTKIKEQAQSPYRVHTTA